MSAADKTPARAAWTPSPSQGPGHGGPARGTGTRPPFAPGNSVALSGGWRSPRVYGEMAQHLAAGLAEARPDLTAYPEAVAAWATIEAQAALLRRRLADVGVLDDDGEPRSGLLRWLHSFENAAAKHRATLGLDPRSEAQLAKERAEAAHLAVDLSALAERGRAAMAAQAEAGQPEPPDLAGEVLARVNAVGNAATARGALEWAQRATDDAAHEHEHDAHESDDPEGEA